MILCWFIPSPKSFFICLTWHFMPVTLIHVVNGMISSSAFLMTIVIGGQQHSKLITLTLQIHSTLQVACPFVASVISEVSQKFCSFLGSRHLKIKLERNATRKNMSRHTTTGYNVCKEKSTQAPSETWWLIFQTSSNGQPKLACALINPAHSSKLSLAWRNAVQTNRKSRLSSWLSCHFPITNVKLTVTAVQFHS